MHAPNAVGDIDLILRDLLVLEKGHLRGGSPTAFNQDWGQPAPVSCESPEIASQPQSFPLQYPNEPRPLLLLILLGEGQDYLYLSYY